MHSAESKAPRNSFKYVIYLSHGVRLCVPLHTHERFPQSWISHSTHLALRGLSLFLALWQCFLPCPHLKRVSRIYSQVGSNMHVHFASTGCRKTRRRRRRNTHSPLGLHTYCSQAPGMRTRNMNTYLPKAACNRACMVVIRPHANAQFSGGGNWIWYLCQLKNPSPARKNKNKETKQTMVIEPPEECNDYNKKQ